MMYIGTSLGGCLKSIMLGEVSEDDVLLIITRTDCPTLEQLMTVVERYHSDGNSYATINDNYNYKGIALTELCDLAHRLWEDGKLHQPRTYGHHGGFIHPDMSRSSLWLEVNPIGLNKTPAVIDAYEKYKVLDTLTK